MRNVCFPALAVAAGLLATTALAAGSYYRLFISPMGEPFRGPMDKPYPSLVWFDGADANHDGVVSRDEFRADALRFFKTLDVNGDGKLNDAEIGRYERQIAPEIVQYTSDTSGLSTPTGDDATDRARRQQAASVTQGAANFGFLNDPEPVRNADADFNLKVTQDEWLAAANRRFRLLVPEGKPGLVKADLPVTPSQNAKPGG